MAFSFIPKDSNFFVLFNRQAEHMVNAAALFIELTSKGSFDAENVQKMRDIEHQADETAHEIMDRLNKTFITPFDREDIHELTARLDDVLDGIQEVAETCVIYAVERPTEEARRLAAIIGAQANQLLEALRKLNGFAGIAAHLHEVHELENEADGLSRAAIGRLFHDRMDPLDVIKWRDLYTALEDTIDAAEDAAEVIERIVAKND
jgi:predicted phosphate transport protein (TIGR00153 family)